MHGRDDSDEYGYTHRLLFGAYLMFAIDGRRRALLWQSSAANGVSECSNYGTNSSEKQQRQRQQ
jgi:hypothetical protein